MLDEHAACFRVARVVARARRRRAADVERSMYHVPLAERTEAAERRRDRRRSSPPVGKPEPAVGLDSRDGVREARRRHRRLVKREQLERAIRGRRDDEWTRLGAQGVLVRREREVELSAAVSRVSERNRAAWTATVLPGVATGFAALVQKRLRVVGVDGAHRLPRHGACPDHRRRGCDSQNQPDQGGEAPTLLLRREPRRSSLEPVMSPSPLACLDPESLFRVLALEKGPLPDDEPRVWAHACPRVEPERTRQVVDVDVQRHSPLPTPVELDERVTEEREPEPFAAPVAPGAPSSTT